MTETILVTGATGTVGGEVVKALLEAPNVHIKVGVRDIEKLQIQPWRQQIEAVTLDYTQPDSLKQALADADKLFLLTVAGTYQEENVINTILTRSGDRLRYIVRLSGQGAEKHNLFANHDAADKKLMAADIDATILRPNMFMQNFYKYSTTIRDESYIVNSARQGKISCIDARDIAAVAAMVLTKNDHAGKTYTLTGGEALDYAEMAAQCSEVLQRKVIYQLLSEQTFLDRQVQAGVPAEFGERFIEFARMVENHEYETVSPDVENILGRPPITFKKFIADYRDQFENK